MRDMKECRAIGREFENRVAEKLKLLGFDVYQDLYVPYRPGYNRYAQVDIVAVNDKAVVTVECKCLSGTIRGVYNQKTWEWINSCGTYHTSNPLRQSYSHKRALEDNLKLRVTDLVVLQDGLCYEGPTSRYVVYLSELEACILPLLRRTFASGELAESTKAKLQQWCNPSDEIKHMHLLTVNNFKNGNAGACVRQFIGVPRYCVMVTESYFYAFTDDQGAHWGTDKIDDAALFETEEEANEIAAKFEDSDVCTLALGGIEIVHDLPGELDGLSVRDYADAVGARPW